MAVISRRRLLLLVCSCQALAMFLFEMFTFSDWTRPVLVRQGLQSRDRSVPDGISVNIGIESGQNDRFGWADGSIRANISGGQRVDGMVGRPLMTVNVGDRERREQSTTSSVTRSGDNDLHSNNYTRGHDSVIMDAEQGDVTFNIDQSDLCCDDPSGHRPRVLVQVHSHFTHKPQRDAIRDTWGRIARDDEADDIVRVVFVLGAVPEDQRWKVLHESKLYRDVITANFVDSYTNLTLKTVSGFRWSAQHCNCSDYLLKTDDDTYINVTCIIDYVKRVNIGANILGALNNNSVVMRQGRWAVSPEVYPDSVYPPYCAGNAYVMKMATVRSLLAASKTMPVMTIEDVYITGILAAETGRSCVGHTGFPHWSVGPSRQHVCDLIANKLFGLHLVHYKEMYNIHHRVKSGNICDTQ